MNIPAKGFVILIERVRNEKRGSGSGTRYRTVGKYRCYLNGTLLRSSDLRGATAEPRGPGNNGRNGKRESLRIEQGLYPLGTHGSKDTKYRTFKYHKSKRPRPGVYVHDTNKRSFILIHSASGFKSSLGCINLTKSLSGPRDNISEDNSFKHVVALIERMKESLTEFPTREGKRIPNAWLVIDGEP